MRQALVMLLGAALVTGACAAAFALHRRARSRSRLWDGADEVATHREQGMVERWLSLAGIRGAGAPVAFAAACVAAGGVGLGVALVTSGSPGLVSAAMGFADLPVIGLPIAQLVMWLPWIAAVFVSALPALLVRARRERRVASVEQDLPLVLELLATLAEGGLGFDASLDRIIGSEPSGRPLIEEMRLYQAETLGGGTRSQCLQRLARRLEVQSVTSSVAALVQAEETGSGLADVLRPLADDLRLRRRERALARAEALPEKLVFPLVVGFLPSLLVWTLGPSLHQVFEIVDSIMRRGP